MIIIPASKQKLRDKIEVATAKYEKSGGVITEVKSNELRSKKENLVRKNLFYSIHHPHYAKETGISIYRLAAIRRTPKSASDDELETLWVYFRKREWSVND